MGDQAIEQLGALSRSLLIVPDDPTPDAAQRLLRVADLLGGTRIGRHIEEDLHADVLAVKFSPTGVLEMAAENRGRLTYKIALEIGINAILSENRGALAMHG